MPRHALGSRSRRLAWLAGLAVVLVARVGGAQMVGVVPTKLVVLDKGTGDAKTVFVAKDAAIQRGTGTDPSGIAVIMTILYDNGIDAPSWGAFAVNNGVSTRWVAYNEKVARYVNRETFTETRVVVIRPGKLAKLVGALGDYDPLEILGQGGAPTGVAKTAFCVQDLSTTPLFSQCFCSEFAGCTWKSIAGGTGAKLVCRGGGTADPSCGGLVPPTTTSTVITTPTTSTTDPPRPVCCSYTSSEPVVTSCHWEGTAGACSAAGGTPGPAGSICQPNGACAPPPLVAGECCLNSVTGCASFVPPNASSLCTLAIGTPVPNAVCMPDGSCAAPTDARCCDSYAGDLFGDSCDPNIATVAACLNGNGTVSYGLPGAPGTSCGGGGDCLPAPTPGTCCQGLDYPFGCYQTGESCQSGMDTVPNTICDGSTCVAP